jgi:NADH:ubiquinone oxidoreductase subunit 3 (subunit A)
MLDGQARSALDDIERHLTRQDPAFAQRLRAGVPASTYSFPTVFILCVLLFLTLPIVTLLFGWAGTTVTLHLFALSIVVVLVRRRMARR